MYTDIKLNGEDYILIREEDVIGIMPRTSEWSCGRDIDSVRSAAGQTRALRTKGCLVGSTCCRKCSWTGHADLKQQVGETIERGAV